jgi:signal transduction histidine kinase
VRSLRARLLVAALLWTIGLAIGTNLLILRLLTHRYPGLLVHYTAMTIFTIGIGAAGVVSVYFALAPFGRLRARMAALRSGAGRRIEGRYPSEVQSLVDDLNGLLADREQSIARAQAHAGNLAHGLKTPLAVLAHEASQAAAAGQGELAAAIAQQVERMRRQVEYHLAHARAVASTAGARCPVLESADALVRTMRRLHADRALAIEESVDAGHAVLCSREDLDEMLGNLIDNACKWARARVRIASVREHASVRIVVDDDGPGLEPSLRHAVLQRGVRADEGAAGSGLGLAIVRDLAEMYGGSIALDASPSGGLRACIELPAA